MRRWSTAEVRGLGVTTDLVTAGSVLGIGRTVAYELAREDRFPVPVLRLGRQWRVPVAPLLAELGVAADSTDAG
ncbi:MAG TPA: DNA-binding protein [Mycobacteriales bacterium]|nr:DNA-binding protein [Mycobacteriales bacterium]